MHLITLFRIMNPHQRCLQAKVKYRNEPKQVMPKSEDLSRSVEINAIWTFDTEFPTIFNKSCTYITFKSAVKHRQLGYGYPRWQTVHLAEATTQDTYSSKYADANLDAPDNAISDNESVIRDAYKPKSNIGMSQNR